MGEKKVDRGQELVKTDLLCFAFVLMATQFVRTVNVVISVLYYELGSKFQKRQGQRKRENNCDDGSSIYDSENSFAKGEH